MIGQAGKKDQQSARNAKAHIGKRRKQDMEQDSEEKQHNNQNISWQKLRSDIYLRDKAICWVCNTFVNLNDYELGHLIDRSNGGHDDYDNLAVMHKSCNLAKPHHESLEDCLKWKLTFTMPKLQQQRGFIEYQHLPRIRRKPYYNHIKKPKKPSKTILLRRQQIYEENLKRIKPATLCWVQGRPLGGALWRILPPPYRQEDMFIMRQTPPDAIDTPDGGVAETIQLIGGGNITQDIFIQLGVFTYHIFPHNGKLSISFLHNDKGNVGARHQTIGFGKGQIPLEAWHIAKSQGITLTEFKKAYLAKHPSKTLNPDLL